MSHSQFHSIKLFILRHAWLNLWDKHMTTGRINQVVERILSLFFLVPRPVFINPAAVRETLSTLPRSTRRRSLSLLILSFSHRTPRRGSLDIHIIIEFSFEKYEGIFRISSRRRGRRSRRRLSLFSSTDWKNLFLYRFPVLIFANYDRRV